MRLASGVNFKFKAPLVSVSAVPASPKVMAEPSDWVKVPPSTDKMRSFVGAILSASVKVGAKVRMAAVASSAMALTVKFPPALGAWLLTTATWMVVLAVKLLGSVTDTVMLGEPVVGDVYLTFANVVCKASALPTKVMLVAVLAPCVTPLASVPAVNVPADAVKVTLRLLLSASASVI